MTLQRRIVGFLLFHGNRDVCDACLAVRLGVTAPEVRAATASLSRKSPSILRDRWACQLCGKQGEVTRALPGRTVASQSNLRRRALRSA